MGSSTSMSYIIKGMLLTECFSVGQQILDSSCEGA